METPDLNIYVVVQYINHYRRVRVNKTRVLVVLQETVTTTAAAAAITWPVTTTKTKT